MRSRNWLLGILPLVLFATVSAQPPAPPPAPPVVKEPKPAPPKLLPSKSGLRDPHFQLADPDENLLFQAWMRRDNASLLALLKKLTVDDVQLAKCDELVRQLGSVKFAEREAAAKQLVALGPAAAAALHRADQSDDAEVRRGAKRCLELIGGGPTHEQVLALVRILLKREVPGSIPVLLKYLPSASDGEIAEEVWFGLDSIVQKTNRVPKELLDGLADRHPHRRAIAACIVANRGSAEQRTAAKKLLTDADPTVRLRTAQGLLAAKDASGIPTLIALLADSPIEVAWQAEELLRYVAGPKSPKVFVGDGGPAQRKACGGAWTEKLPVEKAAAELNSESIPDRYPLLVIAGGDRSTPVRQNLEAMIAMARSATYWPKIAWLFGSDGMDRWNGPIGELGVPVGWGPQALLEQMYRRRGQALPRRGQDWPKVASAWDGTYYDLPAGHVFVVSGHTVQITDLAGRVKWARFDTTRWHQWGTPVLRLIQLGFGPRWAKERDIAETVGYRLQSLGTNKGRSLDDPPILWVTERRAWQWFGARLFVALDRLGLRLGAHFPVTEVDHPDGNRYVGRGHWGALIATSHPSPEVRAKAAQLVAKHWDHEAPTVTPLLVRMTCDEDKLVRYAAIHALGAMHRAHATAANRLARIIEETNDEQAKSFAIGALQRLAPNAPEVIPQLISCLRSSNKSVRYYACLALRAHASSAGDAVRELLRLAVETDYSHAAGAALSAIGRCDEAMIDKLANALETEKTWEAAVLALEGAARHSDAAFAAIVRALELSAREKPTGSGVEFNLVCRALVQIGRSSPKAEGVLIAVAEDSRLDQQLRANAVVTLRRLDAESKEVIATFRRLAESPPVQLPRVGNLNPPKEGDFRSPVARAAWEALEQFDNR